MSNVIIDFAVGGAAIRALELGSGVPTTFLDRSEWKSNTHLERIFGIVGDMSLFGWSSLATTASLPRGGTMTAHLRIEPIGKDEVFSGNSSKIERRNFFELRIWELWNFRKLTEDSGGLLVLINLSVKMPILVLRAEMVSHAASNLCKGHAIYGSWAWGATPRVEEMFVCASPTAIPIFHERLPNISIPGLLWLSCPGIAIVASWVVILIPRVIRYRSGFVGWLYDRASGILTLRSLSRSYSWELTKYDWDFFPASYFVIAHNQYFRWPLTKPDFHGALQEVLVECRIDNFFFNVEKCLNVRTTRPWPSL